MLADRLDDLLFREQVAMQGFYYCTHGGVAAGQDSEGAIEKAISTFTVVHGAGVQHGCACAPPQPGLLLRAAFEHRIDLPGSWLIGASLSLQRALCTQALLLKKHAALYREHLHRPPPPLWHDLAVVAALLLFALGWYLHHEVLTVAAAGTWLVLTGMLIIRRLLDTAKTPAHIAEVMLTSLVLPPLALFWRLVGAARYHLRFARA